MEHNLKPVDLDDLPDWGIAEMAVSAAICLLACIVLTLVILWLELGSMGG